MKNLRMKNEEQSSGRFLILPLSGDSSFFMELLFAVLFYLSFGIRVVYVVPFHWLELLLQVLEGYEQGRYNKDLQYHTD